MSIPKMLFSFQVVEGRAKFQNRATFDNFLSENEGKWFNVTVEKKSRKRSANQNRYLFGVVYPIVLRGFKEAGFNEVKTNEDVHEILKYRFLKREIHSEETGQFVEKILSTASLTTSEFMDYIAEIQQFSSEFLNTYIPEPNEQTLMNYE